MDAREVRRRSSWVKRWRSSGIPAPQFAAQHGLKAAWLYAWSSAGRRASKPAPAFAELRVREEERPGDVVDEVAIEVAVGDCVVRVRRGIDLELLASVIAAVRRC
jgi:hypothetical protein